MKVFIGVPHQSPAFSIELIKESLFDYVSEYGKNADWYIYENREDFEESFPGKKIPDFFPCLVFWHSADPWFFFEVCDPEDEEAKEEIALSFLRDDLNSGFLLSSLEEVEEYIDLIQSGKFGFQHQEAKVFSLLKKAKESFEFWED